MIQTTYPGIYVVERPSGVRAVTGVPTAIAAFVGYTRTGLEHRPVRVQSFADFERGFGGLALESELSYAVSHYFLNGGAEAIIVRVPKNGAAKASVTILAEDASDALTISAIATGTWGNAITVDVDYGPGLTDEQFQLTITDTVGGRRETFGDLSIDKADPRFVEKVVNDVDTGSTLVSVTAAADAKRPERTGTISGSTVLDLTKLLTDKDYALKVTVDQAGGTLTDVPVTVILKDEAKPQTLSELAGLLELRISQALSALVPGARVHVLPVRSGNTTQLLFRAAFDQAKLPGSLDARVTMAAGAAPAGDAVAMLAAALGAFAPASNLSTYHFGTDRTLTNPVDGLKTAAKGGDGTGFPGGAELVGKAGDTPKGLGCLDKVDLFNILSIPDATRPKAEDPGTALLSSTEQQQIWAEALALCVRRRAFLLVDPPPEIQTAAAAIGWKSEKLGINGNAAAAYYPRLRAADPLDRFRLRTFAPSGAVAGVFARTDASRGVWKAPAGIDAFLNGIAAPETVLTDAQQGLLNPLGLNVLRRFPVYGNICFGARTLEGSDDQASEWKYVPVRRTANYIEESLFRGLKWVVFEPNDEPLWAQIRMNVQAFMQGLFLQGAFAGSSPRSAYLVKCDRETNPPSEVNRGIVNLLVGFAPLKPAEFVIITLTQLAGQAQS